MSNPAVLNFKEIVAGLTIKILLGLLYAYIYLNYYQGDDTWKHHLASISETALLRENPKQFFINEYTPVHALNEGTTSREVITLYLNDLQYAIYIKSFAILNLITGGNYYVNMCLFNVLVGSVLPQDVAERHQQNPSTRSILPAAISKDHRC